MGRLLCYAILKIHTNCKVDKILGYFKMFGKFPTRKAFFQKPDKFSFRNKLFHCPSVRGLLVFSSDVTRRISIIESSCYTVSEFMGKLDLFFLAAFKLHWIDSDVTISIGVLYRHTLTVIKAETVDLDRVCFG